VILSMAQAEVTEADRDNLIGEWSDLVVGDRPSGLVSAYLIHDGPYVRVAAVWRSAEAHDAALAEEGAHPAFRVFEAAGADPEHSVMSIVGAFGI
jgi:hypothetical protein